MSIVFFAVLLSLIPQYRASADCIELLPGLPLTNPLTLYVGWLYLMCRMAACDLFFFFYLSWWIPTSRLSLKAGRSVKPFLCQNCCLGWPSDLMCRMAACKALLMYLFFFKLKLVNPLKRVMSWCAHLGKFFFIKVVVILQIGGNKNG